MEIEKIVSEKLITTETVTRKEKVMVFKFKTPKGKKEKSVTVTISFDHIKSSNKRLMRELNIKGGCGIIENTGGEFDNFWLDVNDEIDYVLEQMFPIMPYDEWLIIVKKINYEIEKMVTKLKILDNIE